MEKVRSSSGGSGHGRNNLTSLVTARLEGSRKNLATLTSGVELEESGHGGTRLSDSLERSSSPIIAEGHGHVRTTNDTLDDNL